MSMNTAANYAVVVSVATVSAETFENTNGVANFSAFVNSFNNGAYVSRHPSRKGYLFTGTKAVAEGVAKAGFNVYETLKGGQYHAVRSTDLTVV